MSSAPLRDVSQPGLRWEMEFLTAVPRWTEEPSITIMTKLVTRHLELDHEPELSFFAGGAFNKLYSFDCAKGNYLMRVALPVAPGVKVESEVATLSFVRENTNIPVPRVIVHDSNLGHELGFEWMIMERIDAQPAREVWHEMSWLKKELLVRQIANYSAQLFELRLAGIGSIRPSSDQSGGHGGISGHGFEVGEIVTPDFFIGDTVKLDIDRGPYNSSRNFLEAYVDIIRNLADKNLAVEDEDEDENELGETQQDICAMLATIIPRYFPHHSHRETTTIYHSDINLMNVLVDSDGNVSSIVDWECAVAVPGYEACQLPKFLTGQPYCLSMVPPLLQPNADEDNVKYYYENLMNYECGMLRATFLKEMERISPQWMETFRQERVRRDIMLALTYATQTFPVRVAARWLSVVKDGVAPKMGLTDATRWMENLLNADWDEK